MRTKVSLLPSPYKAIIGKTQILAWELWGASTPLSQSPASTCLACWISFLLLIFSFWFWDSQHSGFSLAAVFCCIQRGNSVEAKAQQVLKIILLTVRGAHSFASRYQLHSRASTARGGGVKGDSRHCFLGRCAMITAVHWQCTHESCHALYTAHTRATLASSPTFKQQWPLNMNVSSAPVELSRWVAIFWAARWDNWTAMFNCWCLRAITNILLTS